MWMMAVRKERPVWVDDEDLTTPVREKGPSEMDKMRNVEEVSSRSQLTMTWKVFLPLYLYSVSLFV